MDRREAVDPLLVGGVVAESPDRLDQSCYPEHAMSETARERLALMRETQDGFRLAEDRLPGFPHCPAHRLMGKRDRKRQAGQQEYG